MNSNQKQQNQKLLYQDLYKGCRKNNFVVKPVFIQTLRILEFV